MPQYEVLRSSYINGRLVEAGEKIQFTGNPGPNLKPLDDDAKKKQAAYQKVVGNRMSSADPGFPLKMARVISGTDETVGNVQAPT